MEQKKPDHTGHRDRMRERVRKYGLSSLEEHEVLEYLLYYAIPRKNTNLIAHALIDRFGSLAGVLDASEEELRRVDQVGPAAAHLLHVLPEVNRCYLRSRLGGSKRLATTQEQAGYLMAQFQGMRRERMLLLALDDKKRLLRAVWLDSGTVSAVDVGMRRIAAEAVNAGAAAVVLAHNHPGGVSTPSREDIESTGEVMRALGILGIRVLDHIVLTDEDYCSMRERGQLPFYDFRTGMLRYY